MPFCLENSISLLCFVDRNARDRRRYRPKKRLRRPERVRKYVDRKKSTNVNNWPNRNVDVERRRERSEWVRRDDVWKL